MFQDIFAAMAGGDVEAVRRLAEEDRGQLSRRRPDHENQQTPLHAAVAPPDGRGGKANHAMLRLLLELGAEVDATDSRGRTPLDLAVLRQDKTSMRLLRDAGAREPAPLDAPSVPPDAIRKATPMFRIPDLAATIGWYESIGFEVVDVFEDEFARLTFGAAELTLSSGSTTGPRDVSLWLITDQIEELYRRMRALAVPFEEDLYEPFYGGRQFSVRDPNGLVLVFYTG